MSALAILLFAGCAKEYDDSALKGRIDDLAAQSEEDANAIRLLKREIERAAAAGLTVKVTETADGWLLEFSDGSSITLPKGQKGEQGDKGEKGDKGDKGDTGDAGSTFDVTITQSPDGTYYIIRVGDKTYTFNLTQTFSLNIDQENLEFHAGETLRIPYTLTGDDGTVHLYVVDQDGFSGEIDEAEKVITITIPEPLPEDGYVIVSAIKNSTGEQSSRCIRAWNQKDELRVITDVEIVPAAGGIVTLFVTSNIDYSVVIPSTITWIQQVATKATVTTEAYLKVGKNPSAKARTATVYVHSGLGDEPVVITQEAGEKSGYAKYLGTVANFYNNGNGAYAKVTWADESLPRNAKSFTYEALLWATFTQDGTPAAGDRSKWPAGHNNDLIVLMGTEYGIQFRYWLGGFGFDGNGNKGDWGAWMALVADGGSDGLFLTTPAVDNRNHQFDANQYPNQTWYHWAVTYDYESGIFSSYLDGQLIRTDNVGQKDMTILGRREDDGSRDRASFYLGYGYEEGRWWPGCITEARVWNRALTAAEIGAEGHAVSVDPSTAQGLIGYWKCNEGSGSTLHDYSGHGNHAEVVSTTPILWQDASEVGD